MFSFHHPQVAVREKYLSIVCNPADEKVEYPSAIFMVIITASSIEIAVKRRVMTVEMPLTKPDIGIVRRRSCMNYHDGRIMHYYVPAYI
ncbi:hypothetical protein TNCV_516131 [Trichonephila clavipes]|nr:hypothetical protein TNCV_516131 [Trichonephila clavipes]